MTIQANLLKLKNVESKPFVKWAGGKRALVDSLSAFIPRDFNTYFEPFVGGGALFFCPQKSLCFLNSTKFFKFLAILAKQDIPHSFRENLPPRCSL